jgi:putative DNA primase/helicase
VSIASTTDAGAQPTRPQALSLVLENIPGALKSLDQWVLWRYELDKDRKWTKIPYTTENGPASSTNRKTWTNIFRAESAYKQGCYDGIGFVVTQESGIVGIDLDHCFDPQGEKMEPWAVEIIEILNSYSEFSPSGTGIRIFVKGGLPDGRRKREISRRTSAGAT